MRIDNLKVYDLEESILASGLPMRTESDSRDLTERDIKRCLNLTKASNGNGAHGQFLTGIRVAFDLTCTNKMWIEALRYRFLEAISSQSTVHRIAKFDLDKQYNSYVDPRAIDIMKEKVKEYNALSEALKTTTREDTQKALQEEMRKKYLELLYTNPAGFELTARMTTNYRCLLNIYIQRHDHRLPEWREFCEYMLNNLPMFKQFVEAYQNNNIEKENKQ